MPADTADIRQHLTSAYSDEELITLCSDYFRDVYDNFAVGMTKAQKIQLVLDHCQRRGLLPNLLAALERDRPDQYRKQFGQVVAEPSLAQPAAMRDPRQVFISHAHQDAEFAHRLAVDLAAHGWRVWIAPDSIRPGEKWVDAINRGLEECGVFLVALTPSAVASKWVTDETNVAKEMQQEGELRFIPLGVADCRVPPLWRVHQRIPFAGRYEQGLVELLAALDPQVGRIGVEASAGSSDPRAQPAEVASPKDHPPSASQPAVPRIVPVPTVQPVAAPDLLTITTPIHLELVRVPAGEFLMGSDPKVDKAASDDEQPQHRLTLPEFYIGRYPVTNEQYAAFVKAARQSAPWHWKNGQIPASKENHPVVSVNWRDAVAFCRWLSEASGKAIRLPTEAEWEKVARGQDGRIYPWGNDPPTKQLCNFGGSGTTPVGRYPAGASPCGALDMAGNVQEWTLSLYQPYPYGEQDGRNSLKAAGTRGSRGGAYGYIARDVRCAARGGGHPSNRFDNVGFRVVASPVS